MIPLVCFHKKLKRIAFMTLAITTCATPLFNRKDLSFVFGGGDGGLYLDNYGLLRALETIVFPDQAIKIVGKVFDQNHLMYQIAYEDYFSSEPLYVDSRCIRINPKAQTKKKNLKSSNEIIESLWRLESFPYVWGGNYSKGLLQMKEWYPPRRALTPLEELNWCFQGVDCSGLLYEVTEGHTPRNTSGLIHFGSAINILGLKTKEIISLIKPLDIFVWKGHVVIALDEHLTIESRAHKGGVYVCPMKERLEQMMDEGKVASNQASQSHEFVLRRWI